MEQNQNQNGAGPQQGQPAGGQTFHAPRTDTWANGFAPGAGGRPDGTAPSSRQVQAELEEQLRAFGAYVTDGLRFGFTGRGQELGARALGVGDAVWDAVNFGLEQGRQAVNNARAQQAAGPYGAPGARNNTWTEQWKAPQAGAKSWFSPPKSILRRTADTRFGIGLAQVIVGGIFLFGLGLGGLICTSLGFLGTAVLATGLSLLAGCLPFLWLTVCGGQNLSASSRLKAYDSVLAGGEAVPVKVLAQATGRTPDDTVRDLKKMIRKGYLTAWLEEASGMLYLTQQAYGAAAAARQAQTAQSAAPAEEENAVLSSMENFVSVLGRQADMMDDDPGAAAELRQMQTTSATILDWLRAHPESLPKARRLASYYIPTTLKLLHTNNEMKEQNTDSAENIRRDIAGMLHTLNIAFGNLHDSLFSDVAMDVSGEIAALQGMLAQDGLSGEWDAPQSR